MPLQQEELGIPSENISPYSARYLFPILYGMIKWYELFNPRQLFILVKTTELIREAGNLVEQEKISNGLSQEDAFRYAEAVTTYLAIALTRYAVYNSLCTVWNYGGQLPAQVAHTISMRGIAMMWNWGDVSPFVMMSGTGTWCMNLQKLCKSIEYLA